LYWLKDHETGKRLQKRESAAFVDCVDKKDKKSAQEVAARFLAPINDLNSKSKSQARASRPVLQQLTFSEFISTKWASYIENRKMEPSTLASYESIINKHLLPRFGDKSISNISAGDVTDFFDSARTMMRPKTISNIFGLLNMMFDVALEYDLIEVKPLKKRLHKPEIEREEKPTLKPEVISQILQGLPYAHRLFVVVISVLTVRVGEALGLRWHDLDFESRTLHLTNAVWAGKLKAKLKTKASKRKFVLPELLVKALESYRLQSQFPGPDDFIFPNSVGGPIEPGNFRKRVLYPVMDALEIEREDRKYGFHILRHTGATILHKETGDIEVAQRSLGHARRSTTEDVYDHAEVVIAEEVTGILLQAITENVDLSQGNEIVN
jgi:integrase